MIEYVAAEDEIFGVANVAWLAAAPGLTIVFPGVLKVEPPIDQIYAECSFVVVKESQASLAKVNGLSIYEATGLLAVQVYAPKADPSSMRTAKLIASAVRDAFRKPSPSGEIWFRDQKVSPVNGNTTKNQVNVVVTCTYRMLK
jgi:hypothetical protein